MHSNLHEKAENLASQKILPSLNHTKIDAYFSKNSEDFIVREVPLYAFCGSGEHLILHIFKKDLTTHEALKILSAKTGAKMREFGFAGLKDKQGATFQYISMPKKFEPNLTNFTHEKMKILDAFMHNNKLKTGHLRGNSFFIRLKKVDIINAKKLENAFKTLINQGFANYFGTQRFGKFEDNFTQGLEILCGKKMKNPKLRDFLLSAFQSELFNRYLSKRVEISRFARDFNKDEFGRIYDLKKDEVKEIYEQKQFFKLLKNEILGHYPHGKCFVCEDLTSENERFLKREISPLGLLLGKKAFGLKMLENDENLTPNFASKIENEIFKNFYKFAPLLNGTRRYLWGFLEDAKFRYDEQNAHFILEFFLQKGSYATVILNELGVEF